MSDVGRARCIRAVAGAVALSGLLLGCGQRSDQLTAAGSSPAPPVLGPPAPTTSFQGAVASVDPRTGTMVVNVSIVWTPVIKRGDGERRVLVDRQTAWEPAPVELSDRLVGGEVQVEAFDAVGGVWPAVKVQLLDID